MASSATDKLRAELAECGKQRREHDAASDELQAMTRKLMVRAYRNPEIRMTEAADLAGIHRTTVYRVYGPQKTP